MRHNMTGTPPSKVLLRQQNRQSEDEKIKVSDDNVALKINGDGVHQITDGNHGDFACYNGNG
jgi:hypothetical protein